MSRSDPDDILSTYRRQAATWDRGRPTGVFEQPWLNRLAALLPSGGHVLDLGCGSGVPIARWLMQRGFAVTGVDGAPEMLELARAHLPEAEWIEADMRTLALDRRFDGIVAWDSFFHLTPDAQRAMFPIFAAHLAPGGALMFTSGPAAGEAWGRVGGEPVYHASLDPEEYVALMAAEGLTLRGYLAEDPDCDRHTVWLARRADGSTG
ncbi:class I SAM-dependent methyltransferase [Pontivivens ytuae]|uniref:Class I SAM-dependent methyltransferase n=1 Tax=Pontivivens ytuae TaxID=2789856 RepID=A0A7S9LUN0_9RHOB|nr:class I SAM-dependent methyltransferase [Pontivivens ytuae]QPH55065.1 class I SAM-dependent methyltransferase [Pontivivens ytuae]